MTPKKLFRLPYLRDADFENYSKYFPEYRWVRFQKVIRMAYLFLSVLLFIYALPTIVSDYVFMQYSFQTKALVIKKDVIYEKPSDPSSKPKYLIYIQYYDDMNGAIGLSKTVDKSNWEFISRDQEIQIYISNDLSGYRLYDELWQTQYVVAILFAVSFFYLYLIFPWLVKIQRESIFK